ncbi:C-terminal binding protein [Lampropedia aestuarii]|uniref:C-terminal binding protein n=1 Tax=Lampropedia aestuarii TaxID=2562762 RepID=UPI0024691F72|nr:C-terminal binding protein [Lampropedia aestuarii]MDH5857810.1 C-terminal binding protein [Lampropedia aestuarii]
MKLKVVIADSVAEDQLVENEVLEPIAKVILAPKGDKEKLKELVRDADAVLTCYTQITEDIVGAMEKCKIIARTGIGVDTIPIKLATEKGIKVTNVPDYCFDEVADHTMALILSLLRGVNAAAMSTREGNWELESAGKLMRLRGRKLGLVGFGNISRFVARRALSFGFDLMVFDPFVDQTILDEFSAQRYALDDLVAEADVLSLHVPLNEKTKHLINSRTLSLMKPEAVLVNTSRGGLVDIKALVNALRMGAIAGAGLDVLEKEPPENIAELTRTSGLILTPHTAFYSEESMRELRMKSATEIARVLKGLNPIYQVN